MLSQFVYRHRAPGYNIPAHFAMYASQWSHNSFLRGGKEYWMYAFVQSIAYELRLTNHGTLGIMALVSSDLLRGCNK
jgi:hypothetical protein